MDDTQWARLWQGVYDAYYDSYYQEIEAEILLRAWQRFDDSVKVLVAITTASSAVSGWALWNEPGFRFIWTTLAAIAALLSITHAALNVPGHLKDWSDIRLRFSALRVDAETIQYKMQLSPGTTLDQLVDEFLVLRKRFGEAVQLIPNDMLRSEGLRNRAQNLLDQKLGIDAK